MEQYRKIYIKSENDLPKEGSYICHFKSFPDNSSMGIIFTNHECMSDCDWYLQPIDITDADEIKHGIPFKCPECGEMIQYGLSEKRQKLIANSRLFKNQRITDADIEAWARNKYPINSNCKTLHDFNVNSMLSFQKEGALEGAKAVLNGEIKHIK